MDGLLFVGYHFKQDYCQSGERRHTQARVAFMLQGPTPPKETKKPKTETQKTTPQVSYCSSASDKQLKS